MTATVTPQTWMFDVDGDLMKPDLALKAELCLTDAQWADWWTVLDQEKAARASGRGGTRFIGSGDPQQARWVEAVDALVDIGRIDGGDRPAALRSEWVKYAGCPGCGSSGAFLRRDAAGKFDRGQVRASCGRRCRTRDVLAELGIEVGVDVHDLIADVPAGGTSVPPEPLVNTETGEVLEDAGGLQPYADPRDEDGRAISAAGEQHGGQVRMAYRLAHRYRHRLLHVHGLGWHHYDGKRWAVDESGVARRAVLDVLATALAESVGDKQLRADVAKCESSAGIEGVLGIASALVEFAATVADLDADPHLLNCANGTLDLRTRQLRPHDPADRLSKVSRGAYRPDADPTEWHQFLATVLPDESERAYLQRVIGQAVYGRVREHLFPVLIGSGANGKSTAYNAMTFALGDYAAVINPELLMSRERGGIGGPELMTLLGARLVIGSETQEGRKLDEATMKRLTGGDELTARHLYKAPVSWIPSHQLVYVTNSLPQVKGNDPAVWRRMRVVPFDVVVPVEDRDDELPERLELQADAVLSWAVAGYFDYLDNGGMREPESVVTATDNYQSQSDAVARFIAEACLVAETAVATTRQLHEAWQDWQKSDGADALSEKAFAQELDRLGYPAASLHGRKIRRGLVPSEGSEGGPF